MIFVNWHDETDADEFLKVFHYRHIRWIGGRLLGFCLLLVTGIREFIGRIQFMFVLRFREIIDQFSERCMWHWRRYSS